MGRKLDVATIFCAVCIIIFTLVGEHFGYGSFKYMWAKYFFILFSVVAAIISWMDLKGMSLWGLKRTEENTKQNCLKSVSVVSLFVCVGLLLVSISLGGLEHVALFSLIFAIGIFLLSCGVHKLKLELLDILVINISGVVIAILLFDQFLDYQPQNTFLYATLSVDGLQTLLSIAVVSGIAFSILDLIEVHFLMGKIKIPEVNKVKMNEIEAADLFPYLKTGTTLSVFVIRPTLFWGIFSFVPGVSTNFFGAVVGALIISSLTPRWRKLLSIMGCMANESLERDDEIARGLILAQVGGHDGVAETYSNDKYGLSIKCPMGWRINDAKLPPETLAHFIDPKGGTINLMAGPTYGTQESIKELENLAIRNVRRFRGKMESLERVKVDGVEAVEAIYNIPLGVKTKKVGFAKNGVEYIITCTMRSGKFEEYKLIFDECIKSFKFKRHNQGVRSPDKDDKNVKSQYDPAYG